MENMNKKDPFEKIIDFLHGNKKSINGDEAENIFYSQNEHFKDALKNMASKLFTSKMDEDTRENAMDTSERIALTVNMK